MKVYFPYWWVDPKDVRPSCWRYLEIDAPSVPLGDAPEGAPTISVRALGTVPSTRLQGGDS